MKKENKSLWILVTVVLVVLIGLIGAKPAWYAWVDLSFYWSEHTETEYRVKTYAEENGYFYAEYPQSLIQLLERNPETADFVLQYPQREEKPVDLSSYSHGKVPLFLQWDPQWGYETYGSDVIGITGCGPSCLAMVGYYLTGNDQYSPDKVAAFAQKNGYYEAGYGSSWTLISQGGPQLGLTVQELPLVKSKMVGALEAGKLIILAMGPGDFTTSGHYIVLTDAAEETFGVHDPNSRIRSEKRWTYEEIEGQIRNIWAISYEE